MEYIYALLILNVVLIVVVLIGVFGKRSSTKTIQELQQLKNELATNNSSEFAKNREELNNNFSSARIETQQYFTNQSRLIDEKMLQLKNEVLEENRQSRQEQLSFQNAFQETVNQQLTKSREEVDLRLKEIQQVNTEKLDEMKKTVDDKLQESMDKHFNESFKLISERLEQVHKGLGEMQGIADGVGDLRKVLSNVKIRGNIGEIQLETLLSQFLSPEQYEKNKVINPDSKAVVEFAIRMPGQKDEDPVFMPIDSKFPVEDYQRLMDSYEKFGSMSEEVKTAQNSFAKTVRKCASDIKTKYIYPPISTGFALMFVPSEGIYAEILRVPGLFEQLQNEYHIAVVGPTNLVAFLNSLQMGFKTLALEKHSHEVWQILGAVKTEFKKFGAEMDLTRRSLQAVVNHVDTIGTRTRAVERKLRNVQELTEQEAQLYFPSEALIVNEEENA